MAGRSAHQHPLPGQPLESRFNPVDRVNGHVDWNRDGVFALSGTTVAAYANYAPGSGGGGCEHTRYHAGKVPNAVSTVGPAVVRLGSRVYVFSNPLGALQHISSTSPWNCRAPNNDPCGTWGAPSFAPTMNVAAGVDAVRLPYSIVAQQILVVGIERQAAPRTAYAPHVRRRRGVELAGERAGRYGRHRRALGRGRFRAGVRRVPDELGCAEVDVH